MTGRRAEIDAGTVLVREGKALDTLFLLDGTLMVTVSQAEFWPVLCDHSENLRPGAN